jgi:CRISPR-associated endoribonuclease Cas6
LIDTAVKGQTVPLGLTLVGRALDYYPYFVLSLEQLGRRGLGRDRIHFTVSRIQCLRTRVVLTRDRCLPEASVFTINPLGKPDNTSKITRFKIIMKTPLRLRKNGQRLFHFDFESFVRAVVRRIELMAKWHCELDLFFRFSHILESAACVHLISDDSRFHDWLKFSRRQNQVIPVGGTLGEVTLEGDYATFEGIFNAAYYLGAGNQTSFGLGQVEFAVADK